MSYVLGSRSLRMLEGVHPALVRIVKRAILVTQQDFAVHDGLRTLDQQSDLVARGMSWTLDSMHLPQADGFAHAADLVPFLGGRLSWNWKACYTVASAVCRAAADERVRLRWGGVWDRAMADYGGSSAATAEASADYVARRRKGGTSRRDRWGTLRTARLTAGSPVDLPRRRRASGCSSRR